MNQKGASILVTGGAGFIGSHFVEYLLLGDVAKVVVLDLLTYAGDRKHLKSASKDSRMHFIRGDIGDQNLVASLLKDHGIDRVAHLAAETHVDRSIDDPSNFVETNVVGTAVLLEAFRQHLKEHQGKISPRFLHASTDEVFGSLGEADEPFDENSRYNPSSPYSASKAGADHLVRSYGVTYGLPVVTTHVSNTYGPRQFPEKLIPLMIRKAIKGDDLPVYGDGRHMRDWMHVEDHCRALDLVLENGRDGATYPVGSGCEKRNLEVVSDIVDAVARLTSDRGRTFTRPQIRRVSDRPGHDRRYAVSSARIRKECGWKPEVSWVDGLHDTVGWYFEHADWCDSMESRYNAGARLGRPVGPS